MKEKQYFEKFLNFCYGSLFYLSKNFKKIFEEIEKEGKVHSEDIEKIKKIMLKVLKLPRSLFIEFLKSCGFVTKEEIEKIFKGEEKNG